MSDSRFGDSSGNFSGDASGTARFVEHKFFSTQASSLNLFQSLDEFSGAIERKYSSPYECLPRSHAESEASFCLPRSVSDIWSQDSCSTCDSVETRAAGPPSTSEFGDYAHLPFDRTRDASFARAGHFGGKQSVILLLSPLIQ